MPSARIVQSGGTVVSISGRTSDGRALVHAVAENVAREDILVPAYNLSGRLTNNVLSVVGGDGEKVPYVGAQIKRTEPKEADCTLLKAGQTAEFDIDLKEFYPHTGEARPFSVSYSGPLGSSDTITVLY